MLREDEVQLPDAFQESSGAGSEFNHTGLYLLLKKAEILLLSQHALSEDINDLLCEAYSWDRDLARWPATRSYEPAEVSKTESQTQSRRPPWWPPKADTYFDCMDTLSASCYSPLTMMLAVYVAAAWNTYRKNRLLLLNVIVQCLERLQEKDAHGRKQAEAAGLAKDVLASIPFHLTYASGSLRQVSSLNVGGIAVGKTIGGMLLMHPLYVASNLPIVPAQLRAHMRECLAWIGGHMGIGQASVFSKVSPLQSVHGLTLTMPPDIHYISRRIYHPWICSTLGGHACTPRESANAVMDT